ncbi:oxidoreductase [Virgibacillus profundi]|uniref:Oxidoreductase n=1 Tax=Virgibacillus profundi TaxID=2024555 RepID=A0A2A2IJG8_9BACI|nr:Gfo/Idh/MocA family oxidoreductase [Virgibacillus profundi]PAV31253.1 oxidoreductase [Virgibacillus profundi]PXY55438.1 gfo/Idh/MocA family oxidoreductase [Virgibacillus profundi]
MSNKKKVVIVGAGVISASHARAITAHQEAKLIAICDIEQGKAEKLANEFGVEKVYTDYEEMFEQEDIDIVSVCVPSGLHAEVTVAAAKNGIHVLCEKPLDITNEKMTKMIEACKSYDVKLGAVYQRRTLDAAIKTRKAIQEGKLGKLVLGDAYLKYYRSPEYYKSAGWRGTWEIDGGGALMNQGIHGVDLIQWMVGDVDSVFAYAAPLVRDVEVEDTSVIAVKYKNGSFGVIQGTTSVYPGQETRFEIHGEKGSIIFGDSGFKQWDFLDNDEEIPQVSNTEGGSSDPKAISNKGHYIFVDDMIQAIKEDREPLVPGEEARKAVDLLLAIYESARTGKEVQLDAANQLNYK